MHIRILKSSAFVFASAALLSLGMSVAAQAGGKYKGKDRGEYCEDRFDDLERQHTSFRIEYQDILNGNQSTRQYRQASAKDARFLHKINSFSFDDCVCDDDDDCDVSRS